MKNVNKNKPVVIISVMLICVLSSCNNNSKESIKKTGQPKFSIHSYMEKDTIFIGEETTFHIEVKNESSDTLVILRPQTRLSFSPVPEWKKPPYEVFSYDGPSLTHLRPNEITDCGYNGLQGFFNKMTEGKRYLKFELELYLKDKKDSVTLKDSMLVDVFPARIAMHSTIEEVKNSSDKYICISLVNTSQKALLIRNTEARLVFFNVPKERKENEFAVTRGSGPETTNLEPKDSARWRYSLNNYFPERTKEKRMLRFMFGIKIEKENRPLTFDDSLQVNN